MTFVVTPGDIIAGAAIVFIGIVAVLAWALNELGKWKR